jgi:hypothetical protein
MTPAEKLQYVKNKIDEKLALSPTGLCMVRVITVREGKFDSPALITREEQGAMYKKFEEEGYIKNLKIAQASIRVEFEKGPDNKRKTVIDSILKEGPVPKARTEEAVSLIVTKKKDDFYYKGKYLNLSKKANYYKVFSALYAKLPEGGEISYKDLIVEIKSRIKTTASKSEEEMQKFIQSNLKDKSNGFVRYSGIPETEDHGKPLIESVRGSGIIFNNKTG